MNQVEAVANAVLYEGYALYPYRPSSIKNQHRWAFGGLFPEAWAREHGEASEFRSELLLTSKVAPSLTLQVRFLHMLLRHRNGQSWQEGVERAVDLPVVELKSLTTPLEQRFSFPGSADIEDGVVRYQEHIDGSIIVSADRLKNHLFRVAIEVRNLTEVGRNVESHDEASLLALTSTHAIVRMKDGAFVSPTNPSEELREAALGCRNTGVWPVLAGEPGSHDCMLVSPIILYDYPEVAPESAGDLFDCTEIDEILTLRTLTLTDAEKEEMRADEHTRRILERSEQLSDDDMRRLHGTLRSPRAWQSLGEKS